MPQPQQSQTNKPISGFSRELTKVERPCIGIYGNGYSGKTRLCATASEWATGRGTTPGWCILDRKSRQTIKKVHDDLGLPLPFMNVKDFMTTTEAKEMAMSDDEEKTKKVFSAMFDKITNAWTDLADRDDVDPLVLDNATDFWDIIGYARLGRREGVKGRYWGSTNKDWADFLRAAEHKTVLLTLHERGIWKNDVNTGKTGPDGPPRLSNTTTTLVRLSQDNKAKLTKEQESEGLSEFDVRYKLDVFESIDNIGLAGVDEVLTGESITFGNLMAMLRPDME